MLEDQRARNPAIKNSSAEIPMLQVSNTFEQALGVVGHSLSQTISFFNWKQSSRWGTVPQSQKADRWASMRILSKVKKHRWASMRILSQSQKTGELAWEFSLKVKKQMSWHENSLSKSKNRWAGIRILSKVKKQTGELAWEFSLKVKKQTGELAWEFSPKSKSRQVSWHENSLSKSKSRQVSWHENSLQSQKASVDGERVPQTWGLMGVKGGGGGGQGGGGSGGWRRDSVSQPWPLFCDKTEGGSFQHRCC